MKIGTNTDVNVNMNMKTNINVKMDVNTEAKMKTNMMVQMGIGYCQSASYPATDQSRTGGWGRQSTRLSKTSSP
jgi:predicted RNase H-related nuclease YkuK (DUF458 family)